MSEPDFDPIAELHLIYNAQVYLLSQKVRGNNRLTDSDIKRLTEITRGIKELEAISLSQGESEDIEARTSSVEKLKESLNRPAKGKK